MKNQSLKSSLKITSLLFVGSLILLSLRPIPQANSSNCKTIAAKVIDIQEKGDKDISITLAQTEGQFYINRGLEKGISVEEWKAKFNNKTIKISYVDHWSPFDPFNKLRSVARISIDGMIEFDKFSS